MKMKTGLLCLLLAGTMALGACASSTTVEKVHSTDVVMTMDGEDITRGEYMLYLYTTTQSAVQAQGGTNIWAEAEATGQDANQILQEMAEQSILGVHAATKYANENGIALAEEDKESILSGTQSMMANIAETDMARIQLSEEAMSACFEEVLLYDLVYQGFKEEYVVDEAVMNAYIDENLELIREANSYLDLDSIVVADAEAAKEALARAQAGEAFDVLFQEYEVDEQAKASEDAGKMSLYRPDYMASFDVDTFPEAGEILHVQATNGYEFILKVEHVTIPTDEETRELGEVLYKQQEPAVYADEKMQELMNAVEIQKVEEEYATLLDFAPAE